MIEDNKNMILNNNKVFNNWISDFPTKHHMRICAIHCVELRKHWALNKKTLDKYVLALIHDGNGYYEIANNRYSISPGKIFLISPNTPFSTNQYEITPNLISIHFEVYQNQNPNILAPFPKSFHINYLAKDYSHFNQLFSSVHASFIKKQGSIKENAVLTSLISDIHQDLLYNEKKGSIDMRIESARIYIEKNINSLLSVDDIYKISGLSKNYFSKKFKCTYGVSPKTYLYHAKMKYAKLLLQEYRYSVSETSQLIGYSDPFIFSNQYKKYFGHSPKKAIELT